MRPASATWAKRHRAAAWGVGLVVLGALGVAVAAMLRNGSPLAAKLTLPEEPTQLAAEAGVVPELQVVAGAGAGKAGARTGTTVRGIVRFPGGEPASGVSVSVLRTVTAWPEWRTELLHLDRAISNAQGVFQFRLDDANGLVVSFAHSQFAGGMVEVKPGESLELQLEPAFELSGVVTNAAGAPLANARIALESVPGDNRRVAVATTTADGAYRFTNLAGGPVRLVARHEAWQPATLPAVVVGDQRQVDIAFDRPAMAPLRGRVTSAVNGAPVADASVELLPLNGKLGLVDTVTTRTAADGTFLLTGLARGSMWLLVRHPDHGGLMRTEKVGESAVARPIELPRRSLLRGQLFVDRGDAPWRGGESLRATDSVGNLAFTTIGADGAFAFAQPLSPGWASLRVLDRSVAFRSLTGEVDVRVEESASTDVELAAWPPGTVRGRVVDERGQPLAGVALTRTVQLTELTDAATQLDLGSLRNQVRQMFATGRDELLARTGADGTFTIRGLEPGVSWVRTSLRGRGSRLLRIVVTGFQASTDLGAIAMPTGCRLQGRVVRGGRPVAGATVQVFGADTQALALTDGNGTWTVDDLSPGGYRVRARLPASPAGSSVEVVTVRPERPTTGVALVFDAGRTVRGTVTGSGGQPVAGAVVAARGTFGAGVSTGADGMFQLELPERTTELHVALADRSQARRVPVPADQSRLSIRLDTPPTCTITAQVAGLPGRKSIGSAVLRLTRVVGDEGETASRWLELTDGLLRWPHCPTGPVRIEIHCDGYAPFVAQRELAANDEHFLGDVMLEPGCRLAGEVRAPDGSPVGNAVVMLGEESDLDLFEAGTRTAADGSFRLSGVSGRSSRLVVRSPGYAPSVVDLVLPQDALASQPLRVTLEPGSTIEVLVGGTPVEGQQVQLRRDGRFVASAETDDGGRVWFANRSAGTYTVHLTDGARVSPPFPVQKGAPSVQVTL